MRTPYVAEILFVLNVVLGIYNAANNSAWYALACGFVAGWMLGVVIHTTLHKIATTEKDLRILELEQMLDTTKRDAQEFHDEIPKAYERGRQKGFTEAKEDMIKDELPLIKQAERKDGRKKGLKEGHDIIRDWFRLPDSELEEKYGVPVVHRSTDVETFFRDAITHLLESK